MPRITPLFGRIAPLMLATLTACQMPVAPAAPPNAGVVTAATVRQMIGGLTDRFTQARQTGGMVGVSAEVQSCYQTATLPGNSGIAWRSMRLRAAWIWKPRASFRAASCPYFSEQAVTRRWAHYNRAANFANIQQEINYMKDVSDAVILEMARRQHAG